MNELPIIQSMWVGPKLSAMEQTCIKSYLYHGHEFHLYTYQETEGIPEGTVVLDGNEIVDKSRIFTYEGGGFGHKSYAGFADVFRYRLLFKKGNWWVDSDSICLKPFDFPTDYVFSTEDPPHGRDRLFNINCGNLKAPAGSEIYKWLVEQSENVNIRMVWGTIGPALMKQAVARFGFQQYVKPPETFCPVPYDYYCRSMLDPSRRWNFTEASYAVHLWNEAWRAQNIDKDKVYHAGCLYETLKQRYGVVGSGGSYVPPPPVVQSVPPVVTVLPPLPPPPIVYKGLYCCRHKTFECRVCIARGWGFRQ